MAAADLNAIRATIESRLATELASSPVLPVVFNNMAYEPTPNSTGCKLDGVRGQYLGHGLTTSGYNRIVGLTLINIFTPIGVGTGINLVIGKRVRDLYNRVIVSGVFSTLQLVRSFGFTKSRGLFPNTGPCGL